jgi:hypothetical protein
MRGTQRVGSLLRLFLSAAFLCLAWVLLSSTQADAAERPAPVELVASLAEPVSASLAKTTPVPVAASGAAVATSHVAAAVLKEPVAAVAATSEPLVAPVVQQVRATTAASVDAGGAGVKAVAESVPLLEAPVVAVVDDVVAVADALPVVGRDPLVDAPLPGRPSVPTPVELPGPDVLVPEMAIESPSKSVEPQQGLLPASVSAVTIRGIDLAAFEAAARGGGMPSVHAKAGTPLGSAVPEPSELPAPRTGPESPMPPTQSAPTPGGAASSGDLASIDPAVVLPSLTTWGLRSSDWRIPRGLPERPGSRPD